MNNQSSLPCLALPCLALPLQQAHTPDFMKEKHVQ